MAKKKKSFAQKTIVRWSDQERVELLAWLDHTLKHDELDFEATVSAHLKQSHQMDCPPARASGKLYNLWLRYGDSSSPRNKWRSDVFTRGSSCFTCFNEEEIEQIQSAVEILEEEYLGRRQTRSLSRSASIQLAVSPRVSRVSRSLASRSRLHSSKSLSPVGPSTPSPIKREVDRIEHSPSDRIAGSKRQRKYVESQRTSPCQSNGDSSLASKEDENLVADSSIPPTLSDSNLEIDDTDEEEASSKVVIPDSSMHRQETPNAGNEGFEEVSKNWPDKTLKAVDHADVVKQSHLVAEIGRLREQLLVKESKIYEVEFERDELDKRVDELESIQRQRDASEGTPIGKTIDDQNIIIKKLARQLDDRRTLGTFTELRPDSGERFGDTRILDGFQDIFSESKCTPYEERTTSQLHISSLIKNNALRLLICNGLSLDPQATDAIENYQVDASSISFHAIVRALTTAAFQMWIFETDFPSFDKEDGSGLLAKYRDHLAQQDGANALRNLDLAAHRSLIRDRRFRKFTIMQKAETLATQLSQTLSPLFDPELDDPYEASWDGFATWGQKGDEWRERRAHLVDLFVQALRLKADSVLNIEEYEMVIYPPGTIFDKNTMTVETNKGMADHFGNHSGREVQLCLDAAIFSYPRKPIGDLTPVSEAIVPSRNFVRKTPAARASIMPILKAVVVLKEDKSDNPELRTQK